MANWRVGAARDLPIVEDESWDGDAAKAGIFNLDQDSWRQGFLFHDADAPENRGSYSFPFARVRDGELVASTAGIRSAAQALGGARQPAGAEFQVPADVRERGQAVIDAYQSKIEDMREEKAMGVIAIGDGVKATGDGRVEGYLVTFTGPERPDLEGEYFDARTDFARKSGDSIGLFFHHGLDGTIKTRRIGDGTVTVDDIGVFVEGQLQLRDAYERAIYRLVQDGKMGWSSGTVANLIERDGPRINQWVLAEASITPTPAEYLNQVIPAKTYNRFAAEAVKALEEILSDGHEDGSTAVRPGGETDININIKVTQDEGERLMSEDTQNTEAVVQQDVAQVGIEDEGMNALREHVDGLTARMGEVDALSKSVNDLLDVMRNTPALRDAGYYSDVGGTADPNAKSFGDFALSIYNRDDARLQSVYKSRKDMSAQSGTAGGYLVPEDFEATLRQMMDMTLDMRGMCRVIPTRIPSGKWPGLDQQTAPTAGVGDTAFAGGVQAFKTDENATIGSTQPLLNLIEWQVHKIAGITAVPTELMQDTAIAIEMLLSDLFARTIRAKEEFYVLYGTGAGEPLGIINSDAKIEVESDASDVFKWVDALEMRKHWKQTTGGRGVWLIHPSVIPQIGQFEVGTGGAAAFVTDLQGDSPTGWKILGWPVMESEHLPQLGNDYPVMLADFNAYAIWQKEGLSIASSEHANFVDGQITWRFEERIDGKPLLSGPITLADPQGSFEKSPFVVLTNK